MISIIIICLSPLFVVPFVPIALCFCEFFYGLAKDEFMRNEKFCLKLIIYCSLCFFCCGSRSDGEIMFKLGFIECLFYLIYIILWPLFVLAYFYLIYGLLIVFSPLFIIYYYSLVVSAFLRINF